MSGLTSLRGFYRLLLVGAALLLNVACSPAGSEDTAPPHMELDQTALTFGPAEDVKPLLVKNTGGSGFSFTAQVSASSNGVEWLQTTPDNGAVDGSSTTTVLVQVVGRDKLAAGSYSGTIAVTADGVGSIVVQVSMEVGQPILDVDPQELNFGAASTTANLVVKNTGAAQLLVALHLPGPWMTTPGALQKSVSPGAPAIFELQVLRDQVPWYGEGETELLVTSNGLDDAGHASTLKVPVRVDVDATCLDDSQCLIDGYFCDLTAEGGVCTQRLKLGKPCDSLKQCLSGACVDGVCCSSPCQEQCRTCNGPGGPGICGAVNDGLACEDGLFCSVDDECVDGTCQAGADMDCSDLDTPCGAGVCDEPSAACTVDAPADTCAIDGECYQAGAWHPDVGCLGCFPENSVTEWMTAPNTCYIDEKCYLVGELTPEECTVCNPANPFVASAAPEGSVCVADANPCTADQCLGGDCVAQPLTSGPCDDDNLCTSADVCVDGSCQGEFHSCDDGLDCTDDECLGEELCKHEAQAGWCVIDAACVAVGAFQPGSGKCAGCKPETDNSDWTAAIDGLGCDDADPCTLLDHCESGLCQGEPNDCDDGHDCTTDLCIPDTGECQSQLKPGWCRIDGLCQQEGKRPPGPDEDCNICDPDSSTTDWTPYHEGQVCDDLSDCTMQSVCLQGTCHASGLPCDDGNVCTQDLCLPDKTCDHPPLEEPTFCTDDLLCTLDDQCAAGICQGIPVDCGATECTPAWCDDDSGECASEPAADGTDCSDEDPCTTDDGCLAGACEGVSKDCSELTGGNPCKLAFCDESGQCVVELKPEGTPCEDGQFCTVGELCDAAGECVGGNPLSCAGQFGQCNTGVCDELADECKAIAKSGGSPCNADSDGCTAGDYCSQGLCIPGPAPDCTQDVPACYKPACQNLGPDEYSCTLVPSSQGVACDDGKFCTVDESCDGAGKCAGGKAKDCQGQLGACQTGTCNEVTDSCKTSPAQDGTVCDDQNDCTLVDSCTNGICVGSVDGCAERRLNTLPGLFVSESAQVWSPHSLAGTGWGSIASAWVASAGPRLMLLDLELSKGLPQPQSRHLPPLPETIGGGKIGIKNHCSVWADTMGAVHPAAAGRPAIVSRTSGEWLWATGNFLGAMAFYYTCCSCGTAKGYPLVVADITVSLRGKDGSDLASLDDPLDYVAFGLPECNCLCYQPTYVWACAWAADNLGLGPTSPAAAVAFSDDSFGLLAHSASSGLTTYRPIDSNITIGAPKDLGTAGSPHACALLGDKVALVYSDGVGAAMAQFLDKNGNSLSEPFAVSDKLVGNQEKPYCEGLEDGRFVVVFNTGFDGGPADVYARVFKPNGSPQTDTIKVNKATNGVQTVVGRPAVFDDGTIVFAWEDGNGDADGYAVKARIFDAALAPVTGDLALNKNEAGDQRWPVVQEAGDGWLVVWASALGGDKYDLYFRKYDPAGAPMQGAPERRANQATAGGQRHGAVAELPEGGFAVAWEGESIDDLDSGIALRLFEPLGAPTSGDLKVNETAAGAQHEPAVAYDAASDRLLVAWTSTGQVEMDDVFARVLDSAGQPVAGEFLVNETTEDVQYEPAVSSCGDGTFAVAWTGDTSIPDDNDVYLRLFDDGGSPLGDELLINADPTDTQGLPVVVSYCDEAGSGILTGWTRTSVGGDVGVYARLFDPAGNGVTGDVLLSDEGFPQQLALARADNGSVMACWRTDDAIRCRRLDAELQPVGAIFDGETDGAPAHPGIVFRSADRFWLTYDRTGADAAGLAVVRADLDLTGADKSSRILVNWHEEDDQSVPFMGMLAADDVFIGWTGADQDGDGDGVFFRVLD